MPKATGGGLPPARLPKAAGGGIIVAIEASTTLLRRPMLHQAVAEAGPGGELIEAFLVYDRDGNGFISVAEFTLATRDELLVEELYISF